MEEKKIESNDASKEIMREDLDSVSGGCGSKRNETITVYCNKCGWETQWSGNILLGMYL